MNSFEFRSTLLEKAPVFPPILNYRPSDVSLFDVPGGPIVAPGFLGVRGVAADRVNPRL